MPRPRLLLLLSLASACAADPAREADRAYTAGLARVESVVVEVDAGPRRFVRARARGVLPDACTGLESADVRRLGLVFEVTLATRRPFGAACAPGRVPFEKVITLRVDPRRSLAYVVTVNGVSASFSVPPDPAGLSAPSEFD